MAFMAFESYQVYTSSIQACRQLLNGSRALRLFGQKVKPFRICHFDFSILQTVTSVSTSCKNYYMELENHPNSLVGTAQHFRESNNNLKSNRKSTEEHIFLKELNQCYSCKDIFQFVSSLENLSDVLVAAIFQQLCDVQLEDNLLKNPEELMKYDIFRSLCFQLEQESTNLSDSGLVNSLNALIKLRLDSQNTLMICLLSESQKRLDKGQLTVKNLCVLGEGLFNLGGPEYPMLEQIMQQIQNTNLENWDVEELVLVYRILQLGIGGRGKFQVLLNKMNNFTVTQLYQFSPKQTSVMLKALTILDQAQEISLIIKLCKHTTRYIPYFTDDEMISVLETFIHFGHSDQCFTEGLERHIAKFAFMMNPDTVSKVMQYCSKQRIFSRTIFDAVAEFFVYNADTFTISQIAELIVPFGKLNYLPPCAPSFFRKLERILSMRFTEFEPCVLLNLLHSCTLIKCYPLNFLGKVFNFYFLQQLQAESPSLENLILSQLTQLFLTVQLECPYYKSPRLPQKYQVKSFHTRCESLESRVNFHLCNQVKTGLTDLLGAQVYFASNVLTPYCYTLDIEIKLNEEGFVLPANSYDEVYERIALCIDDEKRFCANSHNLLGKESMKQRHLSPGEYLQEFEENFRESFNGVAIKNLRVAEAKFQSIREKICQKTQVILAQRFEPRSRAFVKACQVFDLTAWPRSAEELMSYGREDMVRIFEHLEAVPSFCMDISREGIDTRGSLLMEWRELKVDYYTKNGFKDLIGHICKYRQRFPLLNKIIQILKVLPTSTACCEKGRSALQRVRKNNRSRLTLEQLSDLLTIAVNGPPIANFEAKRALDSWFEEKSSNSYALSAEMLSRMSSLDQKPVLQSMDHGSEFYPDI